MSNSAAPASGISTQDAPTASHTELAMQLTRQAARFSRVAGRSAASGYSVVAWRVLAELEQNGECRISELAQREHVSQPSMTGILQRLEGEGWVARTPDPQDGRASLVHLTEAGAAALHGFRDAAAARIAPRLAQLSEFDRATLARAAELLQQLTEGISDSRS